jgi:hypothetical protein
MMAIIQLAIIGAWGALLLMHTRRLYRLATVPVTSDRRLYLRSKAERMWWWLGREEFWARMQRDTARCIETTLMVLLISLGF